MQVYSKLLVMSVGMTLYATPAFAYLDPATGSILIQGAIAAVAGAAVTIKLYWHRLKALFSFKKPKDPDFETENGDKKEEG